MNCFNCTSSKETILLAKFLNNEQSTVAIERAAIPSSKIQEIPVTKQELDLPLVQQFTSQAEGQKVIRSDESSSIDYIKPIDRSQFLIKAVDFDKDQGILVITRNNGQQIRVTGLQTLRTLGTGQPGKRGPKGRPGRSGQDGRDGPDGYEGPQGPVGPQGPIGIAGADGNPGANGRPGPQGLAGPQGPQGPEGPMGRLGHIGEPGYNGCAGIAGPTGPVGPKPSGSFYIGTTPPDATVLLWGYPV